MPYPASARKILRAILLLILVFPARMNAAGYIISEHNAEKAIAENRIAADIEFLSHRLTGGRRTGSMGSTMVAAYLSSRFRDIGLKPFEGSYFRGFRTETGQTGHNVLGLFGGRSRRYIVVAAHYDNIGLWGDAFYPGADSNASGVAAMLSIAGAFSYMNRLGKERGKGIIFVALDAKEQNMGGARALYSLFKDGSLSNPDTGQAITLSDIDMFVNIDQVGSTLSPIHKGREDYLIMLSDEGTGRRNSLLSGNRERGTGLDISFSYYGSRDFTRLFYRKVSDQKVFIEGGIPSVMFTSGITMLNNKTSDVPESLDTEILRKRVLLMYYYLTKIV